RHLTRTKTGGCVPRRPLSAADTRVGRAHVLLLSAAQLTSHRVTRTLGNGSPMQLILFFAFFFLWLAFFGGTVGSFLNVVVYRVPAGMSVVHPPSRCPNCGHDIRWYDNIPVLGWLWLGGRCRDCREP